MATVRTNRTSFKAKADDGTECEIFAHRMVFSESGRPEDERPTGTCRFQTWDGKTIYHTGPGEYVMGDGRPIRLTTVDPAAQ